MNTLIGENYVLKSVSRTYNPVSGWQTTYEFEGEETAINNLIRQFKARAKDLTIENGDSTKILKVIFAEGLDEDQPVFTWEVLYNDFDENILNHPLMWYFTTDVRETFKGYMDGKIIREAGDPYTGKLDGRKVLKFEKVANSSEVEVISVENVPSQLQPLALEFIKLMSMGVTSYYSTQLVLRRNSNLEFIQNLNSMSLYNVQNTYVGAITNTNTLTQVFQLPQEIANILPPAYGIQNDLFKEGWLVKGINSTIQADGRWEVSQEFWYGIWSTLLYQYKAIPEQ